jgi:trimeric autotransporter adhesin
MARQTINIGTNANDGTGDPLRTAFDKINDNFLELYGTDGDANTLQANLDINGFNIVSTRSNEDIRIIPNGTGTIELEKSTNITGALIVSTTAAITGNATVGGTLGVTGLSTLASFKGATGATVTAILDEDTMSSNSDTALATQQSIKAYIDAQNQSQAITFVGDDSTGTAVNNGETFKIAGGTGLTAVVSGDTLTVDIDSTVVTLTGSQVLTNKTLTAPSMTGTASIDNITINDSEIATSSNADLTLNPGGTGIIALSANTAVTGTLTSSGLLTVSSGGADITGTLITDDVTTVGNQTISGNLTTSNLTVQGSVIADRFITNSNGNITIEPSGTGAINLTGTTSVNGDVTVEPGFTFTANNIRIENNTIEAVNSNGGINIGPNGTGIVSIGGTEMQTTKVSAKQLETDQILINGNIISTYESNADLQVDTAGTGTIDFLTPSQTTVGAGAGGSALPGDPVGYLKFKLNGTEIVVPYWNAS